MDRFVRESMRRRKLGVLFKFSLTFCGWGDGPKINTDVIFHLLSAFTVLVGVWENLAGIFSETVLSFYF